MLECLQVTKSAANAASSAYVDAASRASQQYLHAKSIVSVQITGKPKPVHEGTSTSLSHVQYKTSET